VQTFNRSRSLAVDRPSLTRGPTGF